MVTAGQADWEKLCQSIMTDLGSRCHIGVGGLCARPSELPRSLREAGLALRLQKTLLHGSGSCEYPKLGIFRMLAAIPDLSDVEAFVREWLGSLIDYDARRKAELVHTLAQYLEHGGNYDATAAELSVHKSTLKYRLQRIRELTGLELNDPDVHFNLQLATRAWGTLQALHEERLTAGARQWPPPCPGLPGRCPAGSSSLGDLPRPEAAGDAEQASTVLQGATRGQR